MVADARVVIVDNFDFMISKFATVLDPLRGQLMWGSRAPVNVNTLEMHRELNLWGPDLYLERSLGTVRPVTQNTSVVSPQLPSLRWKAGRGLVHAGALA